MGEEGSKSLVSHRRSTFTSKMTTQPFGQLQHSTWTEEVAVDKATASVSRVEIRRIRQLFKQKFPRTRRMELCEMVAAIAEKSQQHYDKIISSRPYFCCPGTLTYVRRTKLFWCTWPIHGSAGAKSKEMRRWRTLTLTQKKKKAMSPWLPKGWRCPCAQPNFPTFVRAVRRKRPPFKPAGIKQRSVEDLQHCKDAEYIISSKDSSHFKITGND